MDTEFDKFEGTVLSILYFVYYINLCSKIDGNQ